MNMLLVVFVVFTVGTAAVKSDDFEKRGNAVCDANNRFVMKKTWFKAPGRRGDMNPFTQGVPSLINTNKECYDKCIGNSGCVGAMFKETWIGFVCTLFSKFVSGSAQLTTAKSESTEIFIKCDAKDADVVLNSPFIKSKSKRGYNELEDGLEPSLRELRMAADIAWELEKRKQDGNEELDSDELDAMNDFVERTYEKIAKRGY